MPPVPPLAPTPLFVQHISSRVFHTAGSFDRLDKAIAVSFLHPSSNVMFNWSFVKLRIDGCITENRVKKNSDYYQVV